MNQNFQSISGLRKLAALSLALALGATSCDFLEASEPGKLPFMKASSRRKAHLTAQQEQPAPEAQPAQPGTTPVQTEGENETPGQQVQCPSIEKMKAGLKPINSISINIVPEPSKDSDRLPPDCAAELLAVEQGEPVLVDLPRGWSDTSFNWKASNLCHNPLRFEDAPLERYGQTWGPVLQPVVSGVRFFATVPTLPYQIGAHRPREIIYTLGYYRPGSCAPYVRETFPVSGKGAVLEGLAIAGLILLIP